MPLPEATASSPSAGWWTPRPSQGKTSPTMLLRSLSSKPIRHLISKVQLLATTENPRKRSSNLNSADTLSHALNSTLEVMKGRPLKCITHQEEHRASISSEETSSKRLIGLLRKKGVLLLGVWCTKSKYLPRTCPSGIVNIESLPNMELAISREGRCLLSVREWRQVRIQVQQLKRQAWRFTILQEERVAFSSVEWVCLTP